MIDNVSIRLRFRSRARDRRPILSAGSDQLHQDLDGHRPNLWQEVEGLDVRKMVNLVQQWKEQVYRQKMTVQKVMKNMTKIFFI